MNENAILQHIWFITLLITTLIAPYNTVYSASTPKLKDIFIGRCWSFQYTKFSSSRPLHLWKNCTNIWGIFHKCFAFKDPCKLTFSDYEPYFAAFGESKVINKSLFWSGTYKAVHSFSDFDLRFTTLEDTFEGSIVNGLEWCGNHQLSRQSSDGIDYQYCPPRNICDYMTPFWGLASKKFAEKARGTIRVMVNGTRINNGIHIKAYSRQSYFGKYELPYLKVNNITELNILVVHTVGMEKIEACNNGSIKTLRDDAEKRGIKTICLDDPDAVKHILCTDHPMARECLFYLSQRFDQPNTKPCPGSWMAVAITFASLTMILILIIVMAAVFYTYCLNRRRNISDDQTAIT